MRMACGGDGSVRMLAEAALRATHRIGWPMVLVRNGNAAKESTKCLLNST
jgi:hypothetical protein